MLAGACDEGVEEACDALTREEEAKAAWLAKQDLGKAVPRRAPPREAGLPAGIPSSPAAVPPRELGLPAGSPTSPAGVPPRQLDLRELC